MASPIFDNEEEEREISIAERTVNLILDHYRISVDDLEDENEQSALKASRKKLIKACEEGELFAELEEGQLTIRQVFKRTPEGGLKEMVYKEINGDSYCRMKNCKDNDMYGKIYALLSASTGYAPNIFKRLKHPDIGTAIQIGLVFIQA